MTISFRSSTADIVRHFRKAALLGRIEPVTSLRKHRDKMRARHESLSEAHVYDNGHLFDSKHYSFLGKEVILRLCEQLQELQTGVGVFMPFFNTIFLTRLSASVGWEIFVQHAMQNDDTVAIHTFAKLVSSDEEWTWLGFYNIARRYTGHFQKSTDLYSHSKLPASEIAAPDDIGIGPVKSAMLLLQKSDTVVREPAGWWMGEPPDKPKAFERPNPSVTVVRVNTPRLIISPPQDAAPSSAPFTPRHVPSHRRMHRNGRMSIVPAYVSPRGYTPAKPAKVVKIVGKMKGKEDGE